VDKCLPQAKRASICREYRKECIAMKRITKRKPLSRDNVSFLDLPLECRSTIFQLADPITLAKLASTCRELNELATRDWLWAPLLSLTFGKNESTQLLIASNKSSAYLQFCRLACTRPDWLIPWKTRRICCHGAIRWIAPQTWQRMLSQPGPAGLAWNKQLSGGSIAFLSSHQVATWLHNQSSRGRVLARILSEWREREIEAREEYNAQQGEVHSALKFWALT
jgi:hypothetical protein